MSICHFIFWSIYILKNFFEVELIYNVVLFSGIQQNDSIYMYIYIHITVLYITVLPMFRFFSLIGYYKILSIVPHKYVFETES